MKFTISHNAHGAWIISDETGFVVCERNAIWHSNTDDHRKSDMYGDLVLKLLKEHAKVPA